MMIRKNESPTTHTARSRSVITESERLLSVEALFRRAGLPRTLMGIVPIMYTARHNSVTE